MGCLQSTNKAERPVSISPQQEQADTNQICTHGSQPSTSASEYHSDARPCQFIAVDPPFMRMAAPNGSPWSQYVISSPTYVDVRTGLLIGPWAECLSAAVCYEHYGDWRSLPEYMGQHGPAEGVVAALEASSAGRPDTRELLYAAGKLEELFRVAAGEGRLLPGCADSPNCRQTPGFGQSPALERSPVIGQTPGFGPSPDRGRSPSCQPPLHHPPSVAGSSDRQPSGHGAFPRDGNGCQETTGVSSALPTLLQRQGQSMEGSAGGIKPAMPAA
mmetsp:Transcript_13536/g.28258  ORF Transcript_13536/g.28258 Transcript_13536/m.28258 type:complete len:273 (-) Transcript_13536:372-1190(-)